MTVSNMSKLRAQSAFHAGEAVRQAGEALLKAAKKNVSLKDHTQEDLANKDHPYARRHGKILFQRLGHAAWLVHHQSGRLAEATRGRSSTSGYQVFFDEAQAPHASYIVMGTRVMLPRDPLMKTAEQKETRTEMMRAVVRVMGRLFRTKQNLRIGDLT